MPYFVYWNVFGNYKDSEPENIFSIHSLTDCVFSCMFVMLHSCIILNSERQPTCENFLFNAFNSHSFMGLLMCHNVGVLTHFVAEPA